jgi:septum site-determining protein MinD
MDGTVALVGAVGGAGTTTLTLECGKLLARAGHDTAILDAAYGTRGLADRVSGRIEPDMTALCLDETPLEAGLIDLSIDGAGRLAACPARAPFERLARAKTAEAAERFEERVAEATRHVEFVLVDVPPVATNPAVAAVSAAGTVAIVADGDRAAAALPRTRDRLADVGVEPSLTVVTRADAHPDADVTVPSVGGVAPSSGDSTGNDALAGLVEATTGVAIERSETGGLLEGVPFR